VKPGKPPRPGDKIKATFFLDKALHRRLKIAAAANGCDMVNMVEVALRRYLLGTPNASDGAEPSAPEATKKET
jgi:hypothetical protein